MRGYERFLGGELKPGEPVPVHSASEMAAAQAEVDTAEQELWRLREEILGQSRPPWAASAAFSVGLVLTRRRCLRRRHRYCVLGLRVDRGQIVSAPFAFSDLVGSKRRPACIVSTAEYNEGPDVIVAMVTSSRARLDRPELGDVVVTDWRAAGLPLPSVVRAGRLLVLEQRFVLRSRSGPRALTCGL